MHLLAVLVAHQAVGEYGFGWCDAFKCGGHADEGVEPVSELAGEGLRDPVGREPVSPIIAIVVVANGRKADDPSVEPSVAHVLDAFGQRTTFRAVDFDRIDPWSVWRVSIEFIPTPNRALFQLITRTDHVNVIARIAFVDRQRETVVALLRDHPVLHVAEPVEFSGFAESGDPFDGFGCVHHRMSQFVH